MGKLASQIQIRFISSNAHDANHRRRAIKAD